MSGHSKWAGIKHKKAAIDAKRGKIFSKIIKEITVACKESGNDPANNAKLRLVIQKAKQFNMPADNIKRAIDKSAKASENYENVRYEGYGPGGAAVIVEAQTDNRNRTTHEVKKIFSEHGGNFGEVGCVGWMFGRKGYILADASAGEDKIMEAAINAGAEDIKDTDAGFEILTSPEDFEKILEDLKAAGIKCSGANIINAPQTLIRLEGRPAEEMLSLMNELENHDDVTEVSSNFDIADEEIEKFASTL